MIITKYYTPGKSVTLYNHKKHEAFKGVLYININNSRLPHSKWEIINLEKMSHLFLGLATVALFIILFPPIYSSINYHLTTLAKNSKPVQQIPTPLDIPISEEFFLEIPKISLISTIIPNVDSENEEQYLEKLKEGVAHAKGSYFPGDSGSVVLFSHSTDTLQNILQYNAKFYALKDLETGDEIKINFKGKQYIYKVGEKKIINPEDLDLIRQSNAKLILTTCWPPGTDWQRIVVFAS